jgi:hypothetical protein
MHPGDEQRRAVEFSQSLNPLNADVAIVRRVNNLFDKLRKAQRRCTDPNDRDYQHYGGRGISFGFRSVWAAVYWVAENIGFPGPGQELDRTDNERGYEPGNLRWATREQQLANRRPSSRKPKRNW